MKLRLFLVLMLLFAVRFSFGQAFTGGITGGISVNQIDGDEYRGYNMLGATGGAYVQTNKSGKLQIQGEIKYFLKGAEQKQTPDNPVFYRVHLNYVQIPVMVNYYLSDKIFPEAGLAAGYLFWAREDRDGNGFLSPSRPFTSIDLSFEGGMNFQITKLIRANIRLSYSILPIRDNPGGQVFRFDLGQYNSSLSFNLYYRILPSPTHKK
jgi:hypothetical protein